MDTTLMQFLMAIVTALPPTLVAFGSLVLAIKTRSKLGEVHDLVNSRFSDALVHIASLEQRLSMLMPGDKGQKAIAEAARQVATPQEPGMVKAQSKDAIKDKNL